MVSKIEAFALIDVRAQEIEQSPAAHTPPIENPRLWGSLTLLTFTHHIRDRVYHDMLDAAIPSRVASRDTA